MNPLSANTWIQRNLRLALGLQRLPAIEYVRHHLAHAASAALMSGFSECAVLTMDGHGEDEATVIWRYSSAKLREVERYTIPDSLGWFYSAFTELFGFVKNTDEGKLMGLAAYGRPGSRWADKVRQVLRWDGGRYRLDSQFIWYGPQDGQGLSRRLVETFGPPRNERIAPFTQDDHDLAFEVQAAFEATVAALARVALARSGSRKLAIAGGCALNCKANGVLAGLPDLDDLFVQPVSSDAGCSIGAALFVQATGESPSRFTGRLEDVYWGPDYSQADVESALSAHHLHYVASDDITQLTADALANGKTVGWFQGPMEAGPRALGGRSILADPTRADAQYTVNRIKRREPWRPFCPSIAADAADRYFIEPKDAPFMIVAQHARPTVHDDIPAVIHVDGTSRPQYVTEARHARFWRLLHDMESLNSHPLVLNTSFNVQGQPIVCSPEDAISAFLTAPLDHLAIENCWVSR